MHASGFNKWLRPKMLPKTQMIRQAMQTLLDAQEHQTELLFQISWDGRVQTAR